MDFLATNEIAEQWNISSCMVVYYCKAGKIAGASVNLKPGMWI